MVCEYYPRGNILGNFTENVQTCTNGTACGAASSLLPMAWRGHDASVIWTWGLWWVVGVGILTGSQL